MEQLRDHEFVNALAHTLEGAQEYFTENVEQVDELPEQGGSLGYIPEDPYEAEPLSPEEKTNLLQGLESLPPQYYRGLCRIVNQEENNEREPNERSTIKLRQIDHYVRRRAHIAVPAGQPGQEQY